MLIIPMRCGIRGLRYVYHVLDHVESMIFKYLVLISMLLHWRIGIVANEDWDVSVTTQSQLDQFIEKVTAYNEKGNRAGYLRLSLGAGENYQLDIVKLMNISLADGATLVMEGMDGAVEINCTASQSDLEELREALRPISHVSLVRMDGIVFTGCPVPIMIEEVDEVEIHNCVFQ